MRGHDAFLRAWVGEVMCPQLKTSNQLGADWGLATTLRSRDARCDAQVERTDFGICLINVVGVETKLHWLQKCQYQVQSRCVQLAAGRPPKPKLHTYNANSSDIWQAKVRYGIEIGQIFAYSPPDISGVHKSRLYFRTVSEIYLCKCSHLLGCW